MGDTDFKNDIRFEGNNRSGVGDSPIRTSVYQVDYDHATLAGGTATVALTSAELVEGEVPPAGCRLIDAAYRLRTAFSGGSLSDCDLDVGDVADVDELVDGAVVFTGDPTTYAQSPGTYTPLTREASAYAPLATFLPTGDTVDNLEAGSVLIYIRWLAVDDPCPEL